MSVPNPVPPMPLARVVDGVLVVPQLERTVIDDTGDALAVPEMPCPDCRATLRPLFVTVDGVSPAIWTLRCPLDGEHFTYRVLA